PNPTAADAMNGQLLANAIYAVICLSVLFQVLTAARFAARVLRKRAARRQAADVRLAAPAPVHKARVRKARVRRRDYRVALRAGRLALSV
ncbi:MAG: hypothetical protein K2V38_06530, partial [Gemmataceae bacterium]|nr:hypothetical protein [Gemmataceae bacterium]